MLSELIATQGVREVLHLRGPVGVMALHGGLEEHTYELANATATRSAASLYAVVLPSDLKWHVPSTCFDPSESPSLEAFLDHVEVAVSVHGFGRRGWEGTVLLGGSNRHLARRLARAAQASTELRMVADLARIPAGLRGLSSDNPVNLPPRGGVQVELSPGARRSPQADALVEAMAEVLVDEHRFPAVGGSR